jgi:predicted DNA-binding transcriptional regulator AlpA
MLQDKTRRYRSKANLAERYSVSERTIDRWKDDGKFPPPDLVLPSGRPRWSDETIELHERSRITRRPRREAGPLAFLGSISRLAPLV